MEITNRHPKEKSPDKAEHWITQIFVQKGHGAGLNATAKTISHYQLIALAQRINKCIQLGKVIAVIRIAHDDKLASGILNSRHQCRTIPALRNMHHTRTKSQCNVLRSVGRAVIRDQYLALHSTVCQKFLRVLNTFRQSARLVQARHENSQFHEQIPTVFCTKEKRGSRPSSQYSVTRLRSVTAARTRQEFRRNCCPGSTAYPTVYSDPLCKRQWRTSSICRNQRKVFTVDIRIDILCLHSNNTIGIRLDASHVLRL